MNILIGFYQGIGDFVSAIPALRSIAIKNTITVLISEQINPLTRLFLLPNVKYINFSLFNKLTIHKFITFMAQLLAIKPDIILVSPHAQDHVTSWKIPILLRVVTCLSKTSVVGARGDKLSILYKKRVNVDKSLPLVDREIQMLKMAQILPNEVAVKKDSIFKFCNTQTEKNEKKTIVIHPGASKENKKWPCKYYSLLVQLIKEDLPNVQIKFIGLKQELDEIQKGCKFDNVLFECLPLEETISMLYNNCSLIVTMDSGFSHIASALGLPHIALYGATDPRFTTPGFGATKVLYINSLKCQPCNCHDCKYSKVYCMYLITPQFLLSNIKKTLFRETVM